MRVLGPLYTMFVVVWHTGGQNNFMRDAPSKGGYQVGSDLRRHILVQDATGPGVAGAVQAGNLGR
jgi:hypothetical protein